MNIKGLMFYMDSKEEINTTNEEIYASSKRKENSNGCNRRTSGLAIHASTEDSIVT